MPRMERPAPNKRIVRVMKNARCAGRFLLQSAAVNGRFRTDWPGFLLDSPSVNRCDRHLPSKSPSLSRAALRRVRSLECIGGPPQDVSVEGVFSAYAVRMNAKVVYSRVRFKQHRTIDANFAQYMRMAQSLLSMQNAENEGWPMAFAEVGAALRIRDAACDDWDLLAQYRRGEPPSWSCAGQLAVAL
jgi:hypothetical protein